jgi:CTP synthase (UTP-ammonia lyase)
LAKIYGRESTTEEYHCSYGLNPEYAARLQTGPLKIAARDDEGDVRAVELEGHPFFVGTLFQPERAALRDQMPPLVRAFVAAIAA